MATLACAGQGEPARSSRFVLTLADGKSIAGTLTSIGDPWRVRMRGQEGVEVGGDQWLTLRQVDARRPDMPSGEHIVFANGDRLPGQVLKLRGDRVQFHACGAEVLVPLSALAVIWIAAPDQEDRPDVFLRRLFAGKRRRDVVCLRNGDTLEGLLTGLERGQRLQIAVAKKNVAANFDKLAAVGLNTELAQTLKPKATYARLVLADGTRLSLVSARLEQQRLIAQTLFGATLTVPLGDAVALDLCQGRGVYLSDLKPTRYETTPFFDVRWTYVLDGSVTPNGNMPAGELRLGGETYEKGIGMHPPSRLSFDLGKAYRRLDARVGLDDRTGQLGSARVSVLLDGKPHAINDGREITVAGGPRDVRIDVTGAGELTLIVEAGRFGDVQAHVDWADARLVK